MGNAALRALLVLLIVQAAGSGAAAGSAELEISGDVPHPLTLHAAELAALPHASLTVKEHDGTMAAYDGIPLRVILSEAGVPSGKQLRGKALASYVLVSAHDGYQVVFSLAELDPGFQAGNVLVADRRERKPMEGEAGPLRLIVPQDKVPARSVRMLEKIQIVMLRK